MTLQRPPDSTPPLYAQDGQGYDAVVHAHYFISTSDWLVTEYSPTQDIAFGWACLAGDWQSAELGYVSLEELEEVAVPVAMRNTRSTQEVTALQRVEYEADWRPTSLRAAIDLLARRQGRGE